MVKIFVSYRRIDSKDRTHRMAEWLSNTYGSEAIFIDIEDIDGGKDFAKVLDENLKASDIMLVVIGDKWLSEFKRRATSDATDYVRHEVAFGLRYLDLVIPLKMNESISISQADLPSDIAPICKNNPLLVRGGQDFENDMNRLKKTIENYGMKNNLFLYKESVIENTPPSDGKLFIESTLPSDDKPDIKNTPPSDEENRHRNINTGVQVILAIVGIITLLYLAGVLTPISISPTETPIPDEEPIATVTETPSLASILSTPTIDTPTATETPSPTITPSPTATFDHRTVILDPSNSQWDTDNSASCYPDEGTFENSSLAIQEPLEVPPPQSNACVGTLILADGQFATVRFRGSQTYCLIQKYYAACEITVDSNLLRPFDDRSVDTEASTPVYQSTVDAMMNRLP